MSQTWDIWPEQKKTEISSEGYRMQYPPEEISAKKWERYVRFGLAVAKAFYTLVRRSVPT